MSSSAGSDSGGGGGRTDAQSQYGGTTGYDSSANQSGREQSFGGGNDGGSFDYEGEAYETPDTTTSTVTTDGTVDPGFQEALRQQAIQQADPVYGDPDPEVDVSPEDRDSITSFFDNYAANVKSNPLELGLIGALKTAYQTDKARGMMTDVPGYGFLNDYSIAKDSQTGGDEGQALNNIISQAPYAILGTTPQESMVNQYFANMGTNQGSPLSSDLQTDYNNAKNSVNSILGITAPTQQFGYSAQPYGLLSSTNMADNPFNIPYLQQRGLI